MTNESIPVISAHDANAVLANGSDALLVDVREDDEWHAGHAPLAIHMPLGRLDAAALPDDTHILTICKSGRRSAEAASFLHDAGHEVSSVAGGMQAWAAAGLPIEGSSDTTGTVK